MKIHSALLASTVSSAFVTLSAAIDTSNCDPIEDLGTTDLDRYNYSVMMDIQTDCSYSMEIKFQHDSSHPVPSQPDHCNPSVVPPVLASDDLPYYAFRWAYVPFSDRIKKATGLDHISLDFVPCGHPPVGVFTIPHYDVHLYRVNPEYRSCMTCNRIPGTPVCDPTPGNQDTSNGKAFFNVNTILTGGLANMPSGFEAPIGDMVPLMGGHAWNTANQPGPTNPWINPEFLLGPYDGEVIFYEPMIPLTFITGDSDNTYDKDLSYNGQTILDLPTKFSVAYDASSGFATISFEGKSNVCNDEKKSTKVNKKTKKNK